jgi:hypothetical protein
MSASTKDQIEKAVKAISEPAKGHPVLNKRDDYRSLYSNNAVLAISSFDFSVTFGEIAGTDENGRLVVDQHTKIMMSPLHMKILVRVLNDNLKAFESNFGEIRVPGEERETIALKESKKQ